MSGNTNTKNVPTIKQLETFGIVIGKIVDNEVIYNNVERSDLLDDKPLDVYAFNGYAYAIHNGKVYRVA